MVMKEEAIQAIWDLWIKTQMRLIANAHPVIKSFGLFNCNPEVHMCHLYLYGPRFTITDRARHRSEGNPSLTFDSAPSHPSARQDLGAIVSHNKQKTALGKERQSD